MVQLLGLLPGRASAPGPAPAAQRSCASGGRAWPAWQPPPAQAARAAPLPARLTAPPTFPLKLRRRIGGWGQGYSLPLPSSSCACAAPPPAQPTAPPTPSLQLLDRHSTGSHNTAFLLIMVWMCRSFSEQTYGMWGGENRRHPDKTAVAAKGRSAIRSRLEGAGIPQTQHRLRSSVFWQSVLTATPGSPPLRLQRYAAAAAASTSPCTSSRSRRACRGKKLGLGLG